MGEDNSKRDVNTQLLLEESLKAVLPLSRPKLEKAASTAILLRPQHIDLTDSSADPCSEAFWLQYRQSQCAQAQERVRGADGQPTEVYVAAQKALDKAQEELAKEVTDARRNRRQLLTQVRDADSERAGFHKCVWHGGSSVGQEGRSCLVAEGLSPNTSSHVFRGCHYQSGSGSRQSA